MLTPMDIQNHEFKKSFRGYDENEVDEFLDRIVSDFEKLLRENEKLHERTSADEKTIAHYRAIEKNLQDTLIVAQKTAEEVIGAARKNAKEIRENATNEAQSIHENTIREAQNIRVQAQLDSKQRVDETIYKLNAAIVEYDKLVREKNSFLWKMRAALESELAVINQLQSSIPTPGEVDTLKTSALQVVKDIKAPLEKLDDAKPAPNVTIEKSETKELKSDEN